MIDIKNIEIPPEVVNEKAYRKYILLRNSQTLINTKITTSEGVTLNITMFPHRLSKLIEHLSPQEQENILEQRKKWNSLVCVANTAKREAYGNTTCKPKTEEQKLKMALSPYEDDIIELLGRMFTVGEVMQIMGEQHGIAVLEEDIKGVLKKSIVEIERRREEFRNKLADVRLYNKRPRLEELTWMYSKMKNRYITLNSTDAYNSMLRTLEQIRKEAEGDILSVNGVLDVNIEVSIQNHLQKEILKTINIKEIILGRVAARMNYDVKKLVAGLHNSYYAKFMTLTDEYDPSATVVEHPSTMPYDFTKIEKEANEEAENIAPDPMAQEDKSTSFNVRQMFLDKIRQQKAELERRQAGLKSTRVDIVDAELVEEEQPLKKKQRRKPHSNLPSTQVVKGKKVTESNYKKPKYDPKG